MPLTLGKQLMDSIPYGLPNGMHCSVILLPIQVHAKQTLSFWNVLSRVLSLGLLTWYAYNHAISQCLPRI